MTTRSKTMFAAGLVAITMAGAAPFMLASASAQATADKQDASQPRHGGPGMGRRGPGGPGGLGGFRGLDLTDDQQAQLRKIRESHAAEFKTVGEKLGAAREGMRALIDADQINESAIRAKSAEVAAAEADFAILNAKVRAESMQILTSEQQAKLKEQRAARDGQMRQRKGPRPPQQQQ